MSSDHQFAIFSDGEGGPLWKGFFPELDVARHKAKELSECEQLEFFVFSFKDYTEVARYFPAPAKRTA